ncbi:MAG: trypsin-like peptidase domain-containing protein, partial [Chloroflexia bacterium]|nr:trypsin-like peptidase domain-containing protein [Chloroflexia bacterium]
MEPNTSKRPSRIAVLSGAASALVVGALLMGSPAFAQEDSPTLLAGCEVPAADLSVADVAERVNPAVVTITNMQRGSGQLPEGIGGIIGGDEPIGGARPVGTGTGFIVDSAGHVVTNAHVVAGASDLLVAFEDGTEVEATVVGQDELLDIAVVELDLAGGREVPATACFGDTASLRPGDQVVAIGSALGEFTNTVSEGTVNAKGRTLRGGYGLTNLIQHDAEIWHGNSGGPLLNLRGEVVGINVAGISGDRMGTAPADIAFAIDGNSARTSVESIIEDGTVERPYLGIQGEALPLGQMVDDVVAGG